MAIYLSIVQSSPTKELQKESLRQKELDRSGYVKIISRRTEHAARVKSLANDLLKKRFGSGGSSNRLFAYKTSISEYKRLASEQCNSARSLDTSHDVGGFYRHKSLEPPTGNAQSLNVNFDLENINSIQGQPSLSMKNRNFKMAERRQRPTSAVIPRGTDAYLESQQV